jgi:hypothetical protein
MREAVAAGVAMERSKYCLYLQYTDLVVLPAVA